MSSLGIEPGPPASQAGTKTTTPRRSGVVAKGLLWMILILSYAVLQRLVLQDW